MGNPTSKGIKRYLETTAVGATFSAFLNKAIDAINEYLVANDPGWQNLTYTNGWSNSAGAQYRVINGVCYLKGRITGGSTGTAFTLPAGARPVRSFTQPVTAGTGTTFSTHLQLNTDGSVVAQTGGSPNLDNISFPVT